MILSRFVLYVAPIILLVYYFHSLLTNGFFHEKTLIISIYLIVGSYFVVFPIFKKGKGLFKKLFEIKNNARNDGERNV